jgi:uncharacterized membrane protein
LIESDSCSYPSTFDMVGNRVGGAMHMVSWLLFVHVLSAMVWLGGGLTLMLAGFRARSSSRPEAVTEFARTVPYVGLRVLMPAVVVLLVTGVWQVLASSSWSFSQLWVRLALGLFILAFLVGAIYLSRVGIGLARATTDNRPASEGAALLNRWLIGYVVVLGLLVVAVWDMIFKPGL